MGFMTYSYDSSGRVSAITGISSITYFPFGMASGWTEPNATTYTRTFDQDGRITGVTLNSTTTNVQTLTYDNASRISELQETGLNNKFYGYDAGNRLTSFFNGTTTTSYTYDANGNRTSMTLSGTTTLGYTTTSNMLQSLSGSTTASYTYDASGNQLTDATATYTYDARGRMATAAAGTTTASYGINGFGQRISKAGSSVPSGGTNEFVYDEKGNLLGEYGSTGTIIEETGYLPNTPVSVLSKGWGIAGLGSASPYAVFTGANGATVSSTTPDWLNAPHIIANSSKTYQWRWDHYDFGNNAPNQNPSGLGVFAYNFRFPGQYYDAESGLFYNGARDYNGTIGRYVQADPLGLTGGQLTLYPYVGNNPLTRTDPLGLGLKETDPIRWWCLITGFCIGTAQSWSPPDVPNQPIYTPPPISTTDPDNPDFPNDPEYCPPDQTSGSPNPTPSTPPTPTQPPPKPTTPLPDEPPFIPGVPIPPTFIPPVINPCVVAPQDFPQLCNPGGTLEGAVLKRQ
jgi:RHS repeat-associated protein